MRATRCAPPFSSARSATPSPANADWVLATSAYGGDFVASVSKGAVAAVQFHPEKSGATGLDILQGARLGGLLAG